MPSCIRTSEDFSFEPLETFLNQLFYTDTDNDNNNDNGTDPVPQLLILIGPFIDIEHSKVDQLDVAFEDIFVSKILHPLEELCSQYDGLQVVLVPSSRDGFHDPVFPQEPFLSDYNNNSTTGTSHPRIIMAPNPCSLVMGKSTTLAVSSTDILKHLAGTEMFKNHSNSTPNSDDNSTYINDRMARLCAHCIGQRSFYPLYPPQIGTVLDVNSALNVNTTTTTTTTTTKTKTTPTKPSLLSSSSCSIQMDICPDVLIVPSDLGVFAKRFSVEASSQSSSSSLSSVVGLNPGKLCRGAGGGSFASIEIPIQSSSSSSSSSSLSSSKLADLATVNVTRI